MCIRDRPSVPLAKTRSEIYSFSDWIWNLTWFSVTLIEDNKNVTVMTDITDVYKRQEYRNEYLCIQQLNKFGSKFRYDFNKNLIYFANCHLLS